jgi:hypothetical protein
VYPLVLLAKYRAPLYRAGTTYDKTIDRQSKASPLTWY